jgi:hypothetical protein
MEFHETGLPRDPIVYQAFVDLNDHFAQQPAGDVQALRSLAIAATRILHENTNATGAALALPLLVFSTPSGAINSLKRNYSPQAFDLVQEAYAHNMTANAYLSAASADVKRLTLANCIATFEQFAEASRKMRDDIEKKIEEKRREAQEAPDTSDGDEIEIKLNIKMPVPEPMRFYNHIAEMSKNLDEGDNRLYALYIDRLNELKAVFQEQTQFLQSRGIAVRLPEEIMTDTRDRRPDFADSGLPQDPKIKACYNLVLRDPRVSDQHFSIALDVANLLGQDKNVGATAIATALLDIAQENWQPVDLGFIRNTIDWDVTELLQSNTVHQAIPVMEIRNTPQEFQQIMVGLQVCKLRRLSSATDTFFDKHLPENAEKVPKEMIHSNLITIQRALMASKAILGVVNGSLGAPVLYGELLREVEKFSRQVDGIVGRFREPGNRTDQKNSGDGPRPPGDAAGIDYSL